ncbi:iron-containing alcohol dehydrogenase [Saccharicrinis aurantiacus]|uniref:iron-containing alcohol dehydrogenase n=1 Tax=Saccharicrinis aurantiacus TaxID=1849719 RepID=UPI00094FDE7F|nr:iron-containing alcohol dehydrogenase [Saccharicrinis aurantiacus]
MNFTFGIGPQIIFGEGESQKIGEIVKSLGAEKVFVIYDQGVKSTGIVDDIITNLNGANLKVTEFGGVEANPSDITVEKAAEIGRVAEVDAIIAIGGGSPMDTAKAVNMLLTNPSPINQYEDFSVPVLPTKPLIAIPTTSGTGSEVTAFSIISNAKEKRKFIVGGPQALPAIALIDPELTYSLPASITASTGIDALTHAIEAYLSLGKNILTDQFALKAIELIYKNLVTVYEDGANKDARANVMLGSSMAGIAFGNGGLGLVHAFAHPFSAYHKIPHGVANAIALPYGVKFNSVSSAKAVKEIGLVMGLDIANLSAEEASKIVVNELKELNKKLNIPTLSETGVKKDDLKTLAEATMNEQVLLMATPRKFTVDEALELLKEMY